MQLLKLGKDEFPISAKTSVTATIFDSYNEHHTLIDEKSALEKLDANEQNEKHIVQAAKGEGNVPTPKGTKVDDKLWMFKSMSFFKAPNRCFVYDHDFFEKVVYYADTEDVQFVKLFNMTHKFIQMTTRQLEQIIFVMERIVKDDLTEVPSMDQVIFLLDKEAPPYPIIKAVYDHWNQRNKLKGSIMKLKEYPPDHEDIRKDYIKKMSGNKKQIKSSAQYIKKLKTELDTIRGLREESIKRLENEKLKRRENIIFLREMVRKVRKTTNSKIFLLLEPELKDEESNYEEESAQLKKLNLPFGMLPEAPTEPAFLNWVQQQGN